MNNEISVGEKNDSLCRCRNALLFVERDIKSSAPLSARNYFNKAHGSSFARKPKPIIYLYYLKQPIVLKAEDKLRQSHRFILKTFEGI